MFSIAEHSFDQSVSQVEQLHDNRRFVAGHIAD